VFNQLELSLRPSLVVTWLLAVFFGVILVLLWSSGLPLVVVISLSLLAVGNALYWFLLHARLALASSPVTLLVEKGHGLRIHVLQKDGSSYRLDHGHVLWITPMLTALRGAWGKPMVVLTRDNCDPDGFRRLRVILKHHEDH